MQQLRAAVPGQERPVPRRARRLGLGGRPTAAVGEGTIDGFVVFLLLGLGPGAAYAGLGLGLALTFRACGVLNLGYGTMALYPAYVFAELRDTGDLVVPGIPGSVHLGDIGTAACVLVALAVGAIVGTLTYAAVFRPLRKQGAPPLASVVAAVGVHIVLESLVTMRFGTAPRLAPTVLPQHTWSIAGGHIPADRLYLTGFVVVVAGAVGFVQRRTRFGLASRAMADDEVATTLLGYDPDRLGIANWLIGSVLAALFGILLAPITGLSPNSYSFLVVPALATAMAGGFSSVALTVVAGVTLGVVQSELVRVELPWTWLGPQVLREVVPFVALAAALSARGSLLPRRGADRPARLPRADMPGHPLRVVATLVVIGSLAVFATSGAARSAVVVSLLGALLCLSLVVLTGYAGQVSLAQMSFAGVAGFALSRLATDFHVPFPMAPLLAAALAGACGVIVGIPALRARGVSFAVMTLGGALAVDQLVFRNLSNGVLAANTVPPPQLGGGDLAAIASDGRPTARFGLLVLALLVACAYAVMRLRRAALGQRMVAVRANERAAAAAGVNVVSTKLAAFGLSAFIAGLGGALMGYHQSVVSASSFTLARSFVTLAAAYLGGIGSVTGALLAGLIVNGGVAPTAFDHLLHIGRYQTLLSGLAMVVVAVRNPQGVASAIAQRRR